jgi:XRE family transcriptional regulator, fatty acid utilization regulator
VTTAPQGNEATMMGRALRELRERRGMTQENLGERVGCPSTYISRIEAGEVDPAFTTLSRLFRALDVDQRELHDVETSIRARDAAER